MNKRTPDGNPTPIHWLSTTEVARELGCSRACVLRLIRSGRLRARRPLLQPGREYRIARSWIDEMSPVPVPQAEAQMNDASQRGRSTSLDA